MVLTLEKEAVHPREAKLRRVQVAYARANATDIWPPDEQSRRQIQICVVLRSRGKARVPAHQPGVSHIADLGNRVWPVRWHYETRLLRWAGHISRMKHDRLHLMLLTSWVPNS